MGIRSRQRLMDRIKTIFITVFIISFGLFISSEGYKISRNIEEIQTELTAVHEYFDEWALEQ